MRHNSLRYFLYRVIIPVRRDLPNHSTAFANGQETHRILDQAFGEICKWPVLVEK